MPRIARRRHRAPSGVADPARSAAAGGDPDELALRQRLKAMLPELNAVQHLLECAYDPEQAPVADEWLGVAELDRLQAVFDFHADEGLEEGSLTAHATIHVIVENQIAMGVEATLQAMERLQRQGLSRHEALHAIGCVVAELIFDVTRRREPSESEDLEARLEAAIERLDAQSWRRDFGE